MGNPVVINLNISKELFENADNLRIKMNDQEIPVVAKPSLGRPYVTEIKGENYIKFKDEDNRWHRIKLSSIKGIYKTQYNNEEYTALKTKHANSYTYIYIPGNFLDFITMPIYNNTTLV